GSLADRDGDMGEKPRVQSRDNAIPQQFGCGDGGGGRRRPAPTNEGPRDGLILWAVSRPSPVSHDTSGEGLPVSRTIRIIREPRRYGPFHFRPTCCGVPLP